MSSMNVIHPMEALDKQEQITVPPLSRSKLQWSALLEIVVFLGALFAADYYLFDGTRYSQLEPHPFWIIVLLISMQYGTRMGLVSALAASMVLVIGNIPQRPLEMNMYEWFFVVFKLPVLWALTSIIIGEVSVQRIREQHRLREELARFANREATLLKSFHKLKVIKEKLEMRIAGQQHTVRKTLKAARDMDQMEPMQVLEQAQVLIDSMLEPARFSIYLLKDNRLELAFEQGWGRPDDYIRDFDSASPLFKSVVRDWNTVCIANPADEKILAGQGVLAGPLIMPKTGELFGMLKIEKHRFSQLSVNTVKDFNSICKWIGSVYGRAMHDSKIYDFNKFQPAAYRRPIT